MDATELDATESDATESDAEESDAFEESVSNVSALVLELAYCVRSRLLRLPRNEPNGWSLIAQSAGPAAVLWPFAMMLHVASWK